MADCTVLRVMPRVRPTCACIAFTSHGPASHTCVMTAASSSPSVFGRQGALRRAFELAVALGLSPTGHRLSIGFSSTRHAEVRLLTPRRRPGYRREIAMGTRPKPGRARMLGVLALLALFTAPLAFGEHHHASLDPVRD